jgi:hypothetical protein
VAVQVLLRRRRLDNSGDHDDDGDADDRDDRFDLDDDRVLDLRSGADLEHYRADDFDFDVDLGPGAADDLDHDGPGVDDHDDRGRTSRAAACARDHVTARA